MRSIGKAPVYRLFFTAWAAEKCIPYFKQSRVFHPIFQVAFFRLMGLNRFSSVVGYRDVR
jgi:hypothetical protein